MQSSFALQFLLRLKQYEEEALQRKHELAEKTYKEVSEIIEKKLASEFKLCSGLDGDMCDTVKGKTIGSNVITPEFGITCNALHLTNFATYAFVKQS